MKKLFILFFIIINLYAGCWSVEEKSESAINELDETITFSFKSATDCKIIDNAKVILYFPKYKKSVSLKTDLNGKLSIPLFVFRNNDNSTITLKVLKEGYIPYTTKLDVELGTIWKKFFLLSPKLNPQSARFVLSWDKTPKDLDLHLVTNDYHISYRKLRSIDGVAQLDQDEREGFGPETITLEKIDKNKTYKLYVKNFSHEKPLDNKAQVAVYIDDKLDKIIKLPNTNKNVVEILEINNDEIIYKNKAINKIP